MSSQDRETSSSRHAGIVQPPANFAFEDRALCKHCDHPEHEGVCGVMVYTAPGMAPIGKVGCMCRVEPHIPASYTEGWIRTYTGKKFHFNNPSLDEICVEDIAHHLAMKIRFSGAMKSWYSVATHSVIGAVQLFTLDRALALPFLFHDCSEAYLPDIPAPIKRRIPWWKDAENKIEIAVCEKFAINPDYMKNPGVKKMDKALVDEEGELFVQGWNREWSAGSNKALRSMIILASGSNWSFDEARFLRTLELLRKGIL